MKVKVIEKVLDYKGKPIKVQERGADGRIKETGEDITYRDVIHQALNNFVADERGKISDKDKMKCFDLSVRMASRQEVEFDREEIVFILKRVNKIQESPLYIGRIKEFFSEKKK